MPLTNYTTFHIKQNFTSNTTSKAIIPQCVKVVSSALSSLVGCQNCQFTYLKAASVTSKVFAAVTTNRSINDIANNCIKVELFKEKATNRQMLAAIFPPQQTVYRCRDIVVTMSPFKIKFR